MLQYVIDSGGRANADPGNQIGSRDRAAAILFFRTMLDQGIDGHREETGAESQNRQQPTTWTKERP